MKVSKRARIAANSSASAQQATPQRFAVNTTDYELRRARKSWAAGLFGALDSKRPRAWDQYGYTETLDFTALLQAYERGGAGHGAVHKLLDHCWQEWPRIKEPEADEESPWEIKLGKVFKAAGVWRKLRDFDRRNLVGRYSAIIYRVNDGGELREPMGRATKLVDVVPLYESQITPTAWESDQRSERYGQPTMYQYRARRPDQITQPGAAGRPDEMVDVHWSRVQILAEGSVGDMFDGVPLLRAGFNNLVDLEKIGGGSAEGFLKNSARTLTLEFEAGASVGAIAATPGQATPTGTDLADKINEKVSNLNSNTDSAIVLQGGKANTLQTQMPDPSPSFMVSANLFAASVRIPFTILFGQQTGRLASDEDRADFNGRAKSRQQNELTPMLEEFVRRMQGCGVVEDGEFEVEWPPLDALGETEQLANAKTMAEINEIQSKAGQPAAFEGNEIRKVAGAEEHDELDGVPLEGGPTDEELAADAARAAAAPPASGAKPAPKLVAAA